MLKLEESIGYLIANTGRKLTQNLTQLFHAYNLTSEQWSLLVSLHNEDKISQKALAERTDKDPANVTRILDQLERKGFVNRVANPEDRRSYSMHITPVGTEAVLNLIPIEKQFIQEITEGIPEAEIEAAKVFLRKLIHNVEQRRLKEED